MPVTVPIEIRFSDIDKLQHVNNANYLSYFEQARLKYFSEVIGGSINWTEEGIILARAEIDFLVPIILEDKLSVEIKVSRIGNKSFDITYVLNVEKAEGKILTVAKGQTVMVCINYKTANTILVPKQWRERITEFEKL
jgi:acyl-CoA thioester hydrolase